MRPQSSSIHPESNLHRRRRVWERAIPAIIAFALAVPSALADDRAILLEDVIWSGFPDGMEVGHDPLLLELAPDGQGFLYYQGPPWPRLMYQPVSKGSPPIMAGAVTPLASRPPRFSRTGDWIYFTARETAPGADPSTPLRARPVRAAFPSMRIEDLAKGRSASRPFRVFLDLHPSGKRVLAAAGSSITETDLSPGGSGSLDVEEIDLEAGTTRHLGLSIAARASAGYSVDGARVLYERGAEAEAGASPRSPPVHALDLVTGAQRLLSGATFDAEVRAGDVLVSTFVVPHRGSFGWDGFRSILARFPGDPAPVPVLSSKEILGLSPIPPRPASFRGGFALLAGGFTDEALPIVARIGRRARTDEAPPAGSARSLLFDPRLVEPAVLARRRLDVEPLLIDLFRALNPRREDSPPEGTPIACLRARFERTGAGGAPEGMIEVLERSPGHLRIERFVSVPVEVLEPGGPAERASSEVFGFDGETCWMKTIHDEYRELSPDDFCAEVVAHSPYRLLLDPAGLGDPGLRFESRSPSMGSGGPAVALVFSYEDGFSGELAAEIESGRMKSLRITTPLLFSTRRASRDMGSVPERKGVTFEDWSEWMGHSIPRRIRFDDGLTLRVLSLVELEAPRELPSRLFEPPGK